MIIVMKEDIETRMFRKMRERERKARKERTKGFYFPERSTVDEVPMTEVGVILTKRLLFPQEADYQK